MYTFVWVRLHLFLLNPKAVPTVSAGGSDQSIVLDGTSSDLARQFYDRAKANDSVIVTVNSVPSAVQSRLDKLNLDWNKLPGLAQLAVLWDSGFAINSKFNAVQMWTLGDHNMSTLALTLDEYETAGCVAKNCTEPDDTVMYESYHCNGAQMNNAAKCVVQEFQDDKTYNAAMWGIGGNIEATPTIRMAKHDWTDNGERYIVWLFILRHWRMNQAAMNVRPAP